MGGEFGGVKCSDDIDVYGGEIGLLGFCVVSCIDVSDASCDMWELGIIPSKEKTASGLMMPAFATT